MINHNELKTLLATSDYSNLSDTAVVAKLNTATVAKRHNVSKVAALNYLLPTKIRVKLKDATTNTQYPKELRDAIDDFLLTITTYEETNFANFDTEAALLQQVGILTQQEVEGFMALSYDYISPAQNLFNQDITLYDVKRARNLDLITSLENLESRAGRAYNELAGEIAKAKDDLTSLSWEQAVAKFEATPEQEGEE